MRAILLVGMVCAGGALAAGATRRPAPDASALGEARAAADTEVDYASSASYAHFLQARLWRAGGDERRALDHLRLALATDPGNPYLVTELAQAHARLGELSLAQRELEKLLRQRPRHAPAHLLLGRVLLEARQPAGARRHLARAIALEPTRPEPYLALIQAHVERGALDEAERVADALAAAVPTETVAWRRLGLVLAERGQPARAERLLRRSLGVVPADAEAWLAVARIAEGRGRLEDAAAALAQAVVHAPEPDEALWASGRLALARGREDEAQGLLGRLVEVSDAPETAVRVALLWLEQGRPERAADALRLRPGRLGEDPRLAFHAGLLFFRLRRYEEAAEAFAAVGAPAELAAEAQVERAAALSLSGRHAEALKLFRDRLGEQPADHRARIGLSRALERAGRPREAHALLAAELAARPVPALVEAHASLLQRLGRGAEALSLLEVWNRRLPDDLLLRFALGLAYERAGRIDDALAHMRRLQREQPEHAPTLNFLGYVLAESGRSLDEAERLIRRALELRPETGAYLDSLGWVLLRKGNPGAAVGVLQRAASLEPHAPVILDHLAEALHRTGRPQEARRQWLRALELAGDPDADLPPGFGNALRGKLEALSEVVPDR